MPQSPSYAELAFQSGPEATLILSARRILRASDMIRSLFGWSPAELEGQSIRRLYPGQSDYEVIGEKAHQALRTVEIYVDQRFMLHKSGEILWVEARGRTLTPKDPSNLAIWTYRALEEAPAGAEPLLTAAERRVAGYLANGFSSKEIAQSLGRSPRTIEVHRANMIRKLGVRNSSELVRKLLGEGRK